MAEEKEALWGQVLLAVGRGAGETRLSNDAVAWLHDRYFPWLDTPSDEGPTPAEVWKDQGEVFLGRFIEIGRRIAAGQPPGAEAGPDKASAAAAGVESTSECPYCPKAPIPG